MSRPRCPADPWGAGTVEIRRAVERARHGAAQSQRHRAPAWRGRMTTLDSLTRLRWEAMMEKLHAARSRVEVRRFRRRAARSDRSRSEPAHRREPPRAVLGHNVPGISSVRAKWMPVRVKKRVNQNRSSRRTRRHRQHRALSGARNFQRHWPTNMPSHDHGRFVADDHVSDAARSGRPGAAHR